MGKIDQIRFGAKAKAILAELEKSPEKQTKLIKVLRDNGFEELAQLLDDLRVWNGGN